jgi:hypothetical protein
MPQTALIRVVLPAPFGPRSAKISLHCISRSISTRALNPFSKVLFSDTIVIALDINGPHDTPRAPSYGINDEAEEGAQRGNGRDKIDHGCAPDQSLRRDAA